MGSGGIRGTEVGRLYVPIVVRAMVVGVLSADRAFYPPTLDYSKLRLNPSGSLVPTSNTARQRDVEKGVHLHWIVPAALTKSEKYEEEDGLHFKRLPNRWYVYRIWREDASLRQLKVRAFMVESDAVQKRSGDALYNTGSPTIPCIGQGRQLHRYLGRAYPLDKAPGPAESYLEAFTPDATGNPYFSAMYQDCRNVLGFYDDLRGEDGNPVTNASLTYLVCGEYASDDPLAAVKSREELLEVFAWEVPSFTPGLRTLCYGVVDSIAWRNGESAYPHAVPEAAPQIAVGNNAAEALAALTSSALPGNSGAERMMQHLLHRNHDLLHEVNGVLKSENVLMKNRFGERASTEAVWLKPREKDAPLPKGAQELLDSIQREYACKNHIRGKLTASRQALYDAWYAYMRVEYAARPTPRTALIKQRSEQAIKRLKPEIETLKRQYNQAEAEVSRLRVELGSLTGGRFTVIEENGQRFWEPNDPLLLFAGIGMDTGREREGSCYRNGLLSCRTREELIQLLDISQWLGESVTVSGMSALPDAPDTDGGRLAILYEAVLLGEGFAEAICASAIKERQLDAAQTRVNAWAAAVRKAREGRIPGAYRAHKPEWNPIYLAWRGAFYPDRQVLREAPSLSGWRIENNEHVYAGPAISTEQAEILQGFSLLTPHASRLAGRVASETLDMSDAAQPETVSQWLSGFHEQCLTGRSGLILPVFDVENPELAREVLDCMNNGSPVTDHNIPEFNGFYAPVRAGQFVFHILHIIDTFGQIKALNDPVLIVAESLRSGALAIRKEITLPPRILQPARIAASWAADPGRDFLCGWVLPNMLEGTLSVYSESGEMLGCLQRSDISGQGVVWRQPPTRGGKKSDLPDGMHPDLDGFLREILLSWTLRQQDLLTPLLKVINAAMWEINPSDARQFDGLGTFLHRPLVLARVTAGYELEGPQRDHRYDDNHLPSELPRLEKGAFPLQIGQRQNQNDGIVGFFLEGDYRRLCLSAGYSGDLPSYFSNENTLTMPAHYPARPQGVTLLMDPVGEANFVSGMLPVKTMKIARERIDKALSHMRYSFFAAQTLMSTEITGIPYPVIEGARWSFSAFPVDGGAEMEEIRTLKQADGTAEFMAGRLWAREGWLNFETGGDRVNGQ